MLPAASLPALACPAGYVQSSDTHQLFHDPAACIEESVDTISTNRFLLSPGSLQASIQDGSGRHSASLVGIGVSMDGKFGMAWLDDFDTREVAGSIVVTAELSGDSPSRVSVYEIHKGELRTLRGLPVPAFTTVFIPGSSTADLKAWLHSVDDVAQATLSPKVPSLAAYASWQVVEILDILQ